MDGVYRLTFTAAPSCQLPDDATRRTYTATIRTQGSDAAATLTGQFWTDGYCGLMNSFDVHVSGSTVLFDSYGGDCGIEEQLSPSRYLLLGGNATATVGASVSTAFNALVAVKVPDGSNQAKVIASCEAPDHQLLFERIAP